jgi:hypothetical protein
MGGGLCGGLSTLTTIIIIYKLQQQQKQKVRKMATKNQNKTMPLCVLYARICALPLIVASFFNKHSTTAAAGESPAGGG